MDDIENEEDLQELEARLYSQVHHESGQEEFAVPEQTVRSTRFVTKTSVVNATHGSSEPRGRYWTDNRTPVKIEKDNLFSGNNSGGVDALVRSLSGKSIGRRPPGTGIILIPASGGDPEKKRSQDTRTKSKVQQTPVADKPGNLFNLKMGKLARNKKLHSKQLKARQARQKQQKSSVETIQVDSSTEEEIEDEDVVEVPLPSPPTLVIDSSDADDDEKPDSISSLKPNGQAKSDGNSRCNSPNSVISDDFIAQLDSSRLLKEVSAAGDEDMQCIVDESRPEEASKVDDTISHQSPDFVTPEKRVSKQSKNKSTYEVTQTNFRAVDVYESESSDMLESVYAKCKRSERNNIEISTSSSSDVEEVEVVTNKTKKLRKRKPSGSCKGSEPNDDSTDSEGVFASANALPYISRGEAVENCKEKLKKRPTSTRCDMNSSDKEFIHKLSNIARGKDDSHDESNESDDEPITARHIAEDVLKQTVEQPIVVEEPAIPNQAITDLDTVLGMIDKMDTSYDDYVEPPLHGRDDPPEENPELFFEELKEKVSKQVKLKKTAKVTGASELETFLYTVYSNREHVAWTEEMVRFYENSWGQERFNVDRMLRMMDRSANWHIRNDDRFPRVKKFANMKCSNCCEYGHPRAKCPQTLKDLICNVCGDIGHREPRCPNTMCFRCGRKSNTFTRSCNSCIDQNRLICPICKIRGHGIDLCPDKWRRYHSTTDVNAHPNQTVFYNEKKFCCICAGIGHLPERCKSSNKFTEYHTPLSEIRSHANSYDDVQLKKEVVPGVVGVNLMCEPNDKVEFPFTSKVTKHQYYGRFLSAVGLYNAGARKRPSTGPISDDSVKKIKKNYVLNPFAKQIMNSTSDAVIIDDDVSKPHAEVIELNISEPMGADVEVTFKAPNDLSESIIALDANKSESIAEKSSGENNIVSNKDKSTEEIATADSDSNYSFSEHFSQSETTETAPKKIAAREVGPLPDFIPLDDSDDDEIHDEEAALDALKGPISGVKQNFDTVRENIDGSEDICQGKIYLNKFHSKFLLSPAGSKFLIENSKKHDVKASMDWNTAGNVLIIDGNPSNQDKFHAELMEAIKNLSDELNRKELEQSQKVPRKRLALIKFLQENILQLDENIGNVNDLQKRIKINENQLARSNFKTTERSRRFLNMILMGQAGLREGRMHLDALQAKLEELQNIDIPQVSDEIRDEIALHWKYIFSSYQHERYDQLIRQYLDLKKDDRMANLKNRLLGKKVLDTTFTKKQMEQLITPLAKSTPVKKTTKPENQLSADLTSTTPKMVLNPLSKPPVTPRTEYGAKKPQQQYRQGQQQNTQQHQQQLPFQQQLQHCQQQPQQYNSQQQHNWLRLRQHQSLGFRQQQPPLGFRQQQQPYQQRQLIQVQNQPQQWQQQPQRQHFQKQFGSGAGSFVSNQIREINQRLENQTDNLVNQISGTTPNLTPKQAKAASCYWSRECMNYIDRCMNLAEANPSVAEKLRRLAERATNNLLSYNDFKALQRVYSNLING